MMLQQFWLLVLIILVATFSCASSADQHDGDFEVLTQNLKQILGCHRNPGMVVSIVKDGKVIYSHGFGTTNEETKANVTSDTLFDLASLTKAFTAALLVDVISKNGSVGLDTTIHDIIGGNFKFADTERTNHATVEDLLSHRIALSDRQFLRFNMQTQRQDYIRFADLFTSKYDFRSHGVYANINYLIAGALVEIIGSKKLESLMQERVFKPLGMKSSTFASAVDFTSPNVAHATSTYHPTFECISPDFTRNWESRCGASCIFSTANDMAEWMMFHLSLGKNSQGQQVFPSSEVKLLHSAKSLMISSSTNKISKPTFPATNFAEAYGLGWHIGVYNGYKMFYHTGSTPGSTSKITLYPTENVGVFTSMRGDDVGDIFRTPLHNYISDLVLGLKPWLNVSTICTFPEPWAKARHSSWPTLDKSLTATRDLSSYIGLYKNDLYGALTISMNTTFGALQTFYGFGHWHLYPRKAADQFYGKGLEAVDFFDVFPFQFSSNDADDKITKLTVGGAGGIETVQFLKHPNENTDDFNVVIG